MDRNTMHDNFDIVLGCAEAIINVCTADDNAEYNTEVIKYVLEQGARLIEAAVKVLDATCKPTTPTQ